MNPEVKIDLPVSSFIKQLVSTLINVGAHAVLKVKDILLEIESFAKEDCPPNSIKILYCAVNKAVWENEETWHSILKPVFSIAG